MHLSRVSKLLGLACCLFAASLSAQATRTWVSGVGDDVNPGSRTAPCKTFAGAISKTAAGGEIDALDPGGFGAITITKAITIDGGGGQVASVLASGTNGIVVNAGATDLVILRNLRINGGGTGLSGIRFLSGQSLVIENCFIDGFVTYGVFLGPSTAANVSISNTTINGSLTASSYVGIMVSAPSIEVDMSQVRVWNSPHVGLYFISGKCVVRDSVITGSNTGVVINGATANVQMNETNISNNGYGIKSFSGALQISNCTITGNTVGTFMSSGTISSYGNNRIDGNTSGNGPLSGTLLQQ